MQGAERWEKKQRQRGGGDENGDVGIKAKNLIFVFFCLLRKIYGLHWGANSANQLIINAFFPSARGLAFVCDFALPETRARRRPRLPIAHSCSDHGVEPGSRPRSAERSEGSLYAGEHRGLLKGRWADGFYPQILLKTLKLFSFHAV